MSGVVVLQVGLGEHLVQNIFLVLSQARTEKTFFLLCFVHNNISQSMFLAYFTRVKHVREKDRLSTCDSVVYSQKCRWHMHPKQITVSVGAKSRQVKRHKDSICNQHALS